MSGRRWRLELLVQGPGKRLYAERHCVSLDSAKSWAKAWQRSVRNEGVPELLALIRSPNGGIVQNADLTYAGRLRLRWRWGSDGVALPEPAP